LKNCTTIAVSVDSGPAELTREGPSEAREEPGKEGYADPSTRSNKAVKRPSLSRFLSLGGVSKERTCSYLRLNAALAAGLCCFSTSLFFGLPSPLLYCACSFNSARDRQPASCT